MINDPYFLPHIFHRRAEKTSFYANNPGLFGVQGYQDLLNIKHGLAAAVSKNNRCIDSPKLRLIRLAQFSMASIKAYEPQIDRSLLVLLDGLNDSQASIALDEWIGYVSDALYSIHITFSGMQLTQPRIRWFTYDVVGSILFGEPIGFLEERQDIQGLVAATSQAFDTIDYLARVPKLSWFYRQTYLGRKLFQFQAEYQNGIQILQTVMNN